MLQHFDPYIMGSRCEDGFDLSRYKTILLNKGNFRGIIREILYKFLGIAPYLLKKARQFQPRLVHVHMGKDATLFLPVSRKLGVPLLVTFHGTDATTSDEWKRSQPHITQKIYLRRRSQLIREADSFIAVSNHVKRALIRQGFPKEKIIVHYIGIDLDQFRPDPAIKREPIVLFVSRLEDFKGCQYLIEAMGTIQTSHPEIKLIIIGEGPFRHHLEEQAKKSLKNYRFLGVQPVTEVKKWMNRAWVLSVPSLTEGLPTVVQESMAMGLPMALFSIPPVVEAVGDDLKECLVPEKDIPALADLIEKLFQNHEMWQKMSDLGRRRVESFFELALQTQKLEEIYLQLISGNSND